MAEYQVIARRYRPKTFKEVFGQESIVKTLKNALQFKRLAHAYLFSGSRGTGKTTLARIFAKALNCEQLDQDGEPCSKCSSCLEIAAGTSIDVLEIDGASHRGIDDIRVISDSVGYASAQGRFKVYIIDEVHMLTKEAFNALLKTLEEPPPQVKFFFATTEPHKVPPTILSRCQRFNLKRIPLQSIMKKLQYIADDQKVEIESAALNRIAEFAEGGLRDAESLFDQIIAFSDGKISLEIVQEVLGVLPRTLFLELDRAFLESDYSACFRIAEEVFQEGKDVHHFLEDLTTHYRSLLHLKIMPNMEFSTFDSSYKAALKTSQAIYTQEQCIAILEKIIEVRGNLKNSVSEKIALESLLLHIVREKNRISIAALTKRLSELEKTLSSKGVEPTPLPIEAPKSNNSQILNDISKLVKQPAPPVEAKKAAVELPKEEPRPQVIQEPVDARLEILPVLAKKDEPIQQAPRPEVVAGPSNTLDDAQKKSKHDTLMQFAAVELGGTIQRKKP